MAEIVIDYTPSERQKILHGTSATQIFYGGAAGGGKSRSMRAEALALCLSNPGIQVYLFRRTNKELEDNHIRPFQKETPIEVGYSFNKQDKRIEFVNGSSINFCYCENEHDVTRYQGSEMHVLLVDEASHLTEYQLTYLRTRVRLGSFEPSEEYKRYLPKIIFASNPGNVGHSFLKQTFVDAAPRETLFFDKTSSFTAKDGTVYPGHLSVFIPATMADNPHLESGYEGQFTALEPELARALKEGDWDAVVGKAIHNLTRDKHMLRPFTPPKYWTKFMCMDWGTAKPFSVGWYCVSEGAELAAKDGYPARWLESGAIIRYKEYYGWDGHADRGCRLDSGTVARKIIEMEEESEELMDYRVGDNAMWAQYDGPSPQENMRNATDGKLLLRKSKKDRTRNYSEIISRLAGSPTFREDGREEDHPMFFATSNCTHFWRTVPTLILDSTDPEKGPDTKQEDHCYDEVSYALRSRPYLHDKDTRYEQEWGDLRDQALGKNADPYATT